jgi:hypothetical protein
MKYDNDIKMDKDLRVMECPKCKNTEFSDGALFCRICATPLYNFCEGELVYNSDNPLRHKNHGNARFCEFCGTQTDYLKLGILKQYKAEIKSEAQPKQPIDYDEIPF